MLQYVNHAKASSGISGLFLDYGVVAAYIVYTYFCETCEPCYFVCLIFLRLAAGGLNFGVVVVYKIPCWIFQTWGKCSVHVLAKTTNVLANLAK